jgi:hypothetical protein
MNWLLPLLLAAWQAEAAAECSQDECNSTVGNLLYTAIACGPGQETVCQPCKVSLHFRTQPVFVCLLGNENHHFVNEWRDDFSFTCC